jgi:hypothetical protein
MERSYGKENKIATQTRPVPVPASGPEQAAILLSNQGKDDLRSREGPGQVFNALYWFALKKPWHVFKP